MDCARALNAESIENLRMHRGPHFQRWRQNHAAAVGGVLIDEQRQRG